MQLMNRWQYCNWNNSYRKCASSYFMCFFFSNSSWLFIFVFTPYMFGILSRNEFLYLFTKIYHLYHWSCVVVERHNMDYPVIVIAPVKKEEEELNQGNASAQKNICEFTTYWIIEIVQSFMINFCWDTYIGHRITVEPYFKCGIYGVKFSCILSREFHQLMSYLLLLIFSKKSLPKLTLYFQIIYPPWSLIQWT